MRIEQFCETFGGALAAAIILYAMLEMPVRRVGTWLNRHCHLHLRGPIL